jgi:class 3 adenylate cyclase
MSSLGGERKIATMLFADLVGSTELASGLDPEEIRGRLEPSSTRPEAHWSSTGARSGSTSGTRSWRSSAPRSPGDDPDRAVAAGLDVAQRVAKLDEGLAVRIGIETGEVLSVPEAGSLRVTGEAVNVAAREAVLETADSAVRRAAAARGQQLYEEAARLSGGDGERLDALRTAGEVALCAWRGDHAMRLFIEAGQAGSGRESRGAPPTPTPGRSRWRPGCTGSAATLRRASSSRCWSAA